MLQALNDRRHHTLQRTWTIVPNVLTAEECARLVDLMTETEAATGGLVGGGPTTSIRRCDVAWLGEEPEYAWINRTVAELASSVNRDAFNFRLDGMDEAIQLTRYRGDEAGFYDWHVDRGGRGAARRRKLSISIQLSPPSAYRGGSLRLDLGGRIITAPKAQGTAVIFPGFLRHRVTPVKDGVRYSLVTWLHGPDFM